MTPTDQTELTATQRDHGLLLLLAEQRLGGALLGGALAAILGSVVWTQVAARSEEVDVGWVAIGIGLLAGILVRTFGKGLTPTYAKIGAGSALAGVALGKMALVVVLISAETKLSAWTVLAELAPAGVLRGLLQTSGAADVIFFGLAIWGGYALARRRIDDRDLRAALVTARAI